MTLSIQKGKGKKQKMVAGKGMLHKVFYASRTADLVCV